MSKSKYKKQFKTTIDNCDAVIKFEDMPNKDGYAQILIYRNDGIYSGSLDEVVGVEYWSAYKICWDEHLVVHNHDVDENFKKRYPGVTDKYVAQWGYSNDDCWDHLLHGDPEQEYVRTAEYIANLIEIQIKAFREQADSAVKTPTTFKELNSMSLTELETLSKNIEALKKEKKINEDKKQFESELVKLEQKYNKTLVKTKEIRTEYVQKVFG